MSGGLFPEFLDRLANCFMVIWYPLPHLSGYKEDFTQPIIVETIAVEDIYLTVFPLISTDTWWDLQAEINLDQCHVLSFPCPLS